MSITPIMWQRFFSATGSTACGTCTPSGNTLTCNWSVQNAYTGHTVTVTVTPA